MSSILYESIMQDFHKLHKPNKALVNRMCHYPFFANSIDEVILDAGFCKTSIDEELLNQIEIDKPKIIGQSEDASFIWVLTNERFCIVNEKWVFGFSMDLKTTGVVFGFNIIPTRSKVTIDGLIDKTTSNEKDSLIKEGNFEITFKGSGAGLSNILNWKNFFYMVEKNIVYEYEETGKNPFGNIRKLFLYPEVDDEKTERDFFVFWLIEEYKEIIFCGISPSLMGTSNHDITSNMFEYLNIFIEGNQAGFAYPAPFTEEIFSNKERFPRYDAFWKLTELVYDYKNKEEKVRIIWEK